MSCIRCGVRDPSGVDFINHVDMTANFIFEDTTLEFLTPEKTQVISDDVAPFVRGVVSGRASADSRQ